MRLFRNICALVALSAILSAGRPANCAESRDGLRPKVLETFLRMRILAAVIETQAVEAAYPGPTDGLVPVSSLGNQVTARLRSHGGAVRDAWNNPLSTGPTGGTISSSASVPTGPCNSTTTRSRHTRTFPWGGREATPPMTC